MSFKPVNRDARTRDIKIAKSNAPRRSSASVFTGWPFVLLVILLALAGLGNHLGWILVGTAILIVVGIGWFILHHGFLTWMRLAHSPHKALARGDLIRAERAYHAALNRARRFVPQDNRRGQMLVALAGYLKQVGRFSEAKVHFEEAVAILEPQWKAHPQAYFVALNNFAVYCIDVLNYADAQRVLEKLLVLSLVWNKGGIKSATAPASPLIELVLHLNLVVLLVRMEELALADDHLQQAEVLFGQLDKPEKALRDWYHGVRALVFQAQGLSTQADAELGRVQDPDHPMRLSVRAKLCLANGDYSQAEQVLRKHLELAGKAGSVHRPDLRDPLLELAECLFGGSKYDEAFRTLEEAQTITRDFELPVSSSWRKTLTNWLHRAQELGRTADAAQLEADLKRASTAQEEAVTLSPRFRIRPPE